MEGAVGCSAVQLFLKGEQMVQLFEPDGTPSLIVTREYAINFCATYPGWTWGEIEEV